LAQGLQEVRQQEQADQLVYLAAYRPQVAVVVAVEVPLLQAVLVALVAVQTT
jgi:hypothetical protein